MLQADVEDSHGGKCGHGALGKGDTLHRLVFDIYHSCNPDQAMLRVKSDGLVLEKVWVN